MNERTELLKRLQGIQNQINEKNFSKELQREEIQKRKAELQFKKTFSEKKHQELLAIQKEIDKKDLDLKSDEEQIKKFNIQLNSIKNNKEYSALRSEISSKEADKSLLEDEILNLMTLLEATEKEYKESIKELRQEESNLEELLQSAKLEIEKADDEIETLKSSCIKYTNLLDSSTLQQFNRLSNTKGKSAIVEVVDNACSGCSMNITLQTLNLLMSGKNLVICPNCQRILFLDDHK